MLPGLEPVERPWMDSNTAFLGRERFASLKCYCAHDVNPGSFPNGFRKSSREQTWRCSRVCCIRLRRRDCARRVLDFPSRDGPECPVTVSPGIFVGALDVESEESLKALRARAG